MESTPLTPDQIDDLLRPDLRTRTADLLVLRDALQRIGGALERLAGAVTQLQQAAGALEREAQGIERQVVIARTEGRAD